MDRCGASHPDNPTVVPCVLVAGHDGEHYSTTGCAGSDVRWPPKLDAIKARYEENRHQRAHAWRSLVDMPWLIARVQALESALTVALVDLGSSHTGHWDPTMQSGAGCPVCIQERKTKAELRAIRDGTDG